MTGTTKPERRGSQREDPMTDGIKVNSLTKLAQAHRELDRMWREHHYLQIEIKRVAGQRTDQQRKAIEVYCRELAEALNDAGLDQRAVMAKMRDGVEIPWSQARIKDVLWRPVQQAMLGKESTTGLSTVEVGQVYEALNRWTGHALGVSILFPDGDDA